jgi:two-component system, NtrC family, response regulator
MKPALLIVDDDEEIRSQMKWALAQTYDVTLAEDRLSAVEAFNRVRPFVVLLDLGLPPAPSQPTEGLATLAELRALDPHVKVVIVSGQSEKQNALRAVGEGAYDFVSKPAAIEELILILKRCFHVAQLEREYFEIRRQFTEDTFESMLGVSPQIQEVFTSIRKVAATDASVLFTGESGTGKEMAARAIHHRSPRKDGPFVAINCGAIPDSLLESELFGHEKGAFTGAHAQRKGRIETASGGTLFLDEIGEIPLLLQVKLLRFLQEQQIERVGGRTTIAIDVRVVSATNADLKKAMAEGRFREDLFYRLAVVVIKLPSLRERRDDLMPLAKSFLRRFSSQNARGELRFSKDAALAIERYGWPGNVRELENKVKRGVIMAEGTQVTADDLELGQETGFTAIRTLKEARETLERELVQQALRRHNGKISPAAAELGVSRPTLYELMEKLGIKRGED